MAIYYVDGGAAGNDAAAGGSGTPWKTLSKAYNTAGPNDTVRVRTATYYEGLRIDKAGMIFEADSGHTPTLDGRYNSTLFGAAGYVTSNGGAVKAGELPSLADANVRKGNWVSSGTINIKGYTGQVELVAAGTVIRGFIIRNCPGRAVILQGNNSVAKDNIIDFTYGGAISFSPTSSGCTFQGNTVTRSSIKTYDPGAPGAGPDAVTTTVIVAGTDHLVKDNIVCYNYGEGISADKKSKRITVCGNTCHTNGHWSLGFNFTAGSKFYNNICYWCDNLRVEFGKPTPGDLFVAGSENATEDNPNTPADEAAEAYSPDIWMYNNLFVGGKRGLVLGGGGRPVQFVRGYIAYNTFVGYDVVVEAGVGDKPVFNWSTLNGAEHANTLVENNIILAMGNRLLTSYKGGGTVVWRNNLFNVAIDKNMSGDGTIIVTRTTPVLFKPTATISGTFDHTSASLPDVTTTFDPANYDLVSSSKARGAASSRSSITNYPNPGIHVDRRGYARDDMDPNGTPKKYYDMGCHEYGVNTPPPEDDTITAGFNRTPGSGSAPLTVNFTDTSTVTGSAAITGWSWSFGDGTTSTSQNPTKIYSPTTPGTHTFTTTLTITDSVNGLTSTFTGGTVTVTVAAAGTVSARFTRTPAAGQAGVTSIAFTDTSTATGDGVVTGWAWNFRDGASSTLQNPTHTYTVAGTYQPRLTVADNTHGYMSTWTGPDTIISAAPVNPIIEASFTQDLTSGQAPLTVTFTDTSQELGGAAITSWLWDFGDGQTSSLQNPTHIYSGAGVFRPTLTIADAINSLTDAVTGQLVTVTTPPPPGAGGDVLLRQTRVALNTSNGNQTITVAGLGTTVPVSLRLIGTLAVTDGTAANGEALSYGLVAGGTQGVAAVGADHGVATTNGSRMWRGDACLLIMDGNGAELVRATFVEWVAGGAVVDVQWTGTPTAYLITAIFGAGTEYLAWVGEVSLGVVGSTTTVTCGFAADAVHAVATWGNENTANVDATISLGLAHRLGGQYVLERWYDDGLADAANRSRLLDGEVFHSRYNTAQRGEAAVTAWTSTGFDMKVTNDAINSVGLVMAEKFGDVGSRVALIDGPTTTGNVDYTLDWDPQYVEHLISPSEALGSYNDSVKAGTIGIHTVTPDGEFSNEISGENGSATTNEQSLSDNQLIVVGHTGTTLVAGPTTLGTLKYSINYATAPATAQKWPSLAVEEGSATGGGGDYVTAAFQVDVSSGLSPLVVQFTDLSSSTNGITSWYWDFGDGSFSTLRNPAHTYINAGEYTVRLTVSDGTIEDEEVVGSAVVVTLVTKREIIVGPFQMRPLTESTTPTTYRDPYDEVNGGYMEVSSSLAHLKLSADPATPTVLPNDALIYMDPSTGDIKILYPDGTIRTVDAV